ncbi:phenylacetate--CoA ligase family protein [Sphingomonas sp.]|uniref:phenylacetate--CoA ligase family protein n=1 Tax=Sphingomonas sp. TaxID=28214 RepID=UPI003D6D2464
MKSSLPLYRHAIDWAAFEQEFPPPDIYANTVFTWSRDQLRDLQDRRFRDIIELAWTNRFYSERWQAAGLTPADIRSLDDIVKLPSFTTDDIKDDQTRHPPFGHISGIDVKRELLHNPIKVQTSSGTTGKPRPSLLGARDWELIGLQTARTLYIQGARPGDVLQIPATNALAQFGWVFYKAAHDYLGIMPITTGSGVVTPGAKQMQIAFDYGTTIIASFPEYLTTLARTAREELGRDVRDLGLNFLPTFLGPDTEGALRAELERLWGCPVYDNYGTNEISIAAFEGPDKDGLYLMEDLVYLEVLDTETGQPVADGETGNLVATCLSRRIPPIIRLNMRDVSRILPCGTSALGSNFRRMDHFLGRSDDMAKVRGVNIYPAACLSAVRSDDRTTGEWMCLVDRATVDGVIRDDMVVQIEIRPDASGLDGLEMALAGRLKQDLGLKVRVELVAQGALSEVTNIGKEGKARRLIDRRFAK